MEYKFENCFQTPVNKSTNVPREYIEQQRLNKIEEIKNLVRPFIMLKYIHNDYIIEYKGKYRRRGENGFMVFRKSIINN